jgi:DNA-binding SARP family transcriptional activator
MAAWGYGLLGPVEVRVDGHALPLPGARQRLLLAEHPEREQARGLLMQALYRAGRHTEALATARSWRRHLATELGLDPSPPCRRSSRTSCATRRGRRIPAVRPRTGRFRCR